MYQHEIYFRMVLYALQNREKVVRSGNNRVIMKDPRYVVVSVRRNPKTGMLFGTAYDSDLQTNMKLLAPTDGKKIGILSQLKDPDKRQTHHF